LFPIEGASMPYFAYAASKTGDTVELAEYVMKPSPHDFQNFDVLLSRAFFAAARKDVDEAYRLLSLAFRAKPYSGERPVNVDYQYAQACEWLYRDTRDVRFVEILLDWARRYQSVQPTSAWAYAVQFQYEKDGDTRMRALALTQFLDPLSIHIRSATKAELKQAQKWFTKNNPFATPKDKDEAPTRIATLTDARDELTTDILP
jgi:hypothetical protein